MGEGTFGFDLPGIGPIGGYGGFGLPDAFAPGSGKTAVNCALGDADVRNVSRYGVDALYNYARVVKRYGGLRYGPPCFLGEKLQAAIVAAGGDVGFLDVLNGIGTTIGGVLEGAVAAIPGIVDVTRTVVGGVRAVQDVINGGTGGGAVMSGTTMQAPSASMMNGNTNLSGQAAFEMACRADPACTSAVWAALQGGQVAPMMNGSAPMNEDAMLAALGFPPALIMQLRSIPGAIGRILGSPAGQIAVGVGGGLVGTAIGTAALSGGMSMGMRLPRRIQVPDGKGGVREYVSRGRPILYSGDISAVRRVRKIAARVPRPRRSRPRPLLISGGTANVCGKCLTAPCACGGH